MTVGRAVTVRRLLPLLAAVVLAVGLAPLPPLAPAATAAPPDLTIVSDTRYEVQPDERRVVVTVDLVATNRLRDTATRRYYFDRAFLAVLPHTTEFRLTGGSGRPSVAVSRRTDDFTLLQLNFGERIHSGKSGRFQLRFVLPDPGGASTRDVRIGTTLVAFPAWAFATDETKGGSITVVFPADFTVNLEAGDLPEPTSDDEGRIVFRSGTLDAPLDFFAYFVADRPGSYEETAVTARVGNRRADLTVRAWPDDPDWAERVGGLFRRGLPVLGEAIGLPWSRTERLVVEETVSRTTGGYAGLFDPRTGQVEVAYYADTFVILHEAAHAWFNGALLADRWANEGFASYYALRAAAELEEEATAEELTDELREARIPLNGWGAVGREDAPIEDYAYAASLELARTIAERAGDPALRRVWAAAARGEGAYQPTGGLPAERATGVPDWRGLLDLLEDATAKRFDDLWREWVVRPGETALLDDRRTARERYAETLEAAGAWDLPRSVRAALRAWQFDQATELLDAAAAVIDRRAELDRAAAAAGLDRPDSLEAAFEGDAGFDAALAVADAEMTTIETIVDAASSRIERPDPVEALGLVGTTPEVDLDEARTAFGAGDLPTAAREAAIAGATWAGAADVGRNRLLTIAGVVVLLVLAALFLRSEVRRRRERAGAPAPDPDVA